MDKVGRSELRERLKELHSRAFNIVEIYGESEQQKLAKEEYQKLFKEFMDIPVDLGTLTLTKIVKFQFKDGTEIKANQRSCYIQGKPFILEYDKDKKLVKAIGTVVDQEVGQLVRAEYVIEVKPEVIEPIQEMTKIPELPKTSIKDQLPDQKTVDWLMLKKKCPRCQFENTNAMLERSKCCSNCTLPIDDWENYTKENGKDSKKYEGPKKSNYKPLGFRNFLNRNKKVG